MENNRFDDKEKQALSILFERFWILRSDEPELYKLVRERENGLKKYVSEKFGFELIVHQHFIKLEKIPAEVRPWMGIQDFQLPMDYAIFCCGLAFTESRSVDDQFLLSHICEEIKELYPGEFELDWTNYSHRKSLVRALKKLTDLEILKVVDGEVDHFAQQEDYEVLYEVTVYARYFMRTYPEDLFRYDSVDEILQSEWRRHAADERRKRVYRRLFFSPVVHREAEEDPDFSYIRNFRNRLAEDIESRSPYRLEVFKNAAMLVMDERRNTHTLFPDNKGISDVLLHLAAGLREQEASLDINPFGEVRLTPIEFGKWLRATQESYGHGWSKEFREGTEKSLNNAVLKALVDWEFAYVEAGTAMVVLRPSFARLAGKYPDEYLKKKEKTDGQSR